MDGSLVGILNRLVSLVQLVSCDPHRFVCIYLCWYSFISIHLSFVGQQSSAFQNYKFESYMQESHMKEIVLKAMGQAISKTVAVAEFVKVDILLLMCDFASMCQFLASLNLYFDYRKGFLICIKIP